MGKFEKSFIVFTILYTFFYIPFFFNFDVQNGTFSKIVPFHLIGMALWLGFIIIVIRDIYKRNFENSNSKNTWTMLVLLFWPSVFIYLFKYGFKSRTEIGKDENLKKYIAGLVILIICFFGYFAFSAFRVFHVSGNDIQELAISGKNERLLEILQKNPDAANEVRNRDNWSPIHGAAFNNHPKTVKILAQYGADINLKTCNGETPLHGASEYGYAEVVKALIEAGADINIKDDKGKTALDIARWYNHNDIAELLEKLK